MASMPPITSPRDPSGLVPGPPIENELPTYRAISPMAVASLILGLLSALNFASWSLAWLSVAVMAILTGMIALRRIGRMPDTLTGRSFAQAGVAMGLVFGVASQALFGWQLWDLRREVRAFAEVFQDTLKDVQQTRPLTTDDAVWFMIPSQMRRGLTPEDAKEQLEKVLTSSEKVRSIDDTLRAMIAHAGGKPIRFVKVEEAHYNNMDALASLLMEVEEGEGGRDEPGDKILAGHDHTHVPTAAKPHDHADEPPGMDNALVLIRSSGSTRSPSRWNVETIRYPYVPDSYKAPIKAPDDGHGHDH